MNECEGLMNEIEHEIQAPTASPERLLGLVGNLSSSTIDGPRAFPSALKDKLYGIASHHEGEVPIHGRFFAQWLHFAFPNECPYPHHRGCRRADSEPVAGRQGVDGIGG